jgi:hypothetical protein
MPQQPLDLLCGCLKLLEFADGEEISPLFLFSFAFSIYRASDRLSQRFSEQWMTALGLRVY